MAAVADATVTAWLALTLPRINPDLFGAVADQAQVWLTAHELASEPGTGAVVPVVPGAQSITVGPVSVTYRAGATGPASSTSTTAYGLRYEALLRGACVAAASLIMAEPTP
jgi:hypothetical protein